MYTSTSLGEEKEFRSLNLFLNPAETVFKIDRNFQPYEEQIRELEVSHK